MNEDVYNQKRKKKVYTTEEMKTICRQKFSKSKWDKISASGVDVVVIGSGPASLCTAAILARVGNKRVLVLEQNEVLGGGMHEFKGKTEMHDTGLHYVGLNSDCIELVNLLLTDGDATWSSLGPVYDEIVAVSKDRPSSLKLECCGDEKRVNRPEQEEDYMRGIRCSVSWFESYKKHLVDTGKMSLEQLRSYALEIQKVESWQVKLYFTLAALPLPTCLVRALRRRFCATFYSLAAVTVEEKLKSLGIGEEAAFWLCGQCGDYSPDPAEASFFVHAGVVSHYMNGACYPQNGPAEIVARLAQTVKREGRGDGGDLFAQAFVRRIVVSADSRRVLGVEVVQSNHRFQPHPASATFIPCEQVVSGIGWENTRNLFGGASVPRPLAHRFEPAQGFFFLFVELTHPEFVMPAHNVWLHDRREEKREGAVPFASSSSSSTIFVSSSSSKRRSGRRAQTATVLMKCPPQALDGLFPDPAGSPSSSVRGSRWRKKSGEYQELKAEVADFLLRRGLFRAFPELGDGRTRVLWSNVGTPFSCETYLGSRSVYGLASTPERYADDVDSCSRLLPAGLGVRGLFMTGQDVLTPGFAGAVGSAEITSNRILWRNLLLSPFFSSGSWIGDVRSRLRAGRGRR